MVSWVPPRILYLEGVSVWGFVIMSSAQSVFGKRRNKYLYGQLLNLPATEKVK